MVPSARSVRIHLFRHHYSCELGAQNWIISSAVIPRILLTTNAVTASRIRVLHADHGHSSTPDVLRDHFLDLVSG